MMVVQIGGLMAGTLAFLSAEAAIVSLFRIIRISQGMPIPEMPPSVVSPRSLLLWAFALYMIGSTGREAVVLIYGLSDWPEMAMRWSATARAVQIGSACLFVYALTARYCGHWIWTSSLAMAVTFAAVVTK